MVTAGPSSGELKLTTSNITAKSSWIIKILYKFFNHLLISSKICSIIEDCQTYMYKNPISKIKQKVMTKKSKVNFIKINRSVRNLMDYVY